MYDLSKLQAKLTDEQLNTFDLNVLYKGILASAGSGKTRTIVYQIINDLNNGIPPDEIVAFTFTNKAASELLNRIKQLAKENIPDINLNGIFIGTIHSWCFEFLSKKNRFINFTTLDELQQYSLLSRLYDELKLNQVYRTNFPKGIKEFIKDLEVYYNENLKESDIPDKILSAILVYKKVLFENRLLDFGSLINHTISELINFKYENPKITSLYVDEYQDVNPAQVDLVKSMLSNKTKLTVVGDDLQCIYNWRGSDVRRIIDFQRDFPINSKLYRLNYNFRSTKTIVNLANEFSETVLVRDLEKKMIVKKSINDSQILYCSSINEKEQANNILSIINNFISNGFEYKDIAILLRSIKSSSEEIIDVLSEAKIPIECTLLGRGTNFVFRLVVPLMEWVAIPIPEPKSEEEEQEIEKIAENLWLSSKEYITNTDVTESVFWKSVNKWKKEITDKTNDAYNIRKQLYTFLFDVDISISENSNDLINALGILTQIIRSNEEIHRRRILGRDRKTLLQVYRECIDSIKLNYYDFGETTPISYSNSGILITTIHQSKGLEFPIVIIPMIDRNRFPVRQSSHGTSYSDIVAYRYGTTQEDERRLFYVALTRAKDRLILLDTASYSLTDSSIFIRDIFKRFNQNLIYSLKDASNDFWNFQLENQKHESTIQISLSDLLIYIECSFQYAIRRKGNIQPQIGDELGYGKGLHEIIQRVFLNKLENKYEDISEMVDLYIHIPYQSSEVEKASKISINDRVKVMENVGLFNLNILPEVSVEIYFEDYVIDGIIDAIQINDDGTTTIYDWKSNIHPQFIDRYKWQMLFYAYALSIQGYKIKNAILVDVGESFKQQKLVSINLLLDTAEYNSVKTIIHDKLLELSNNIFVPTQNHESCIACDMSNICKHRIKC